MLTVTIVWFDGSTQDLMFQGSRFQFEKELKASPVIAFHRIDNPLEFEYVVVANVVTFLVK